MNMRVTAGSLFSAALCAATLCGCSSSATAKHDVTVSACTAGTNGGLPIASGQIKNHSSKASTYVIHVKFRDSSGNKVADGVSAVGKVDSGKTANWHADGSAHANGPLKCSIASVTRTVAP